MKVNLQNEDKLRVICVFFAVLFDFFYKNRVILQEIE